jgi:threonylcarbamoyladenosine tRNA methylthiotransferase MtaB
VRSGTTAAKFPDKIPQPVIDARSRQIRQLGEAKKAAFSRGFIGHTLPVLFEHTRDRNTGLLKGYSRNYIRVLAEGGDELMNREVPVVIRRTNGETARGVIE